MQIRLHHRRGFVVMTTIKFPPSLYHRSAIIIISGVFFSPRHHLFPALPLTVWCRGAFLEATPFILDSFWKLTRFLGHVLQFPLLFPFGGNCNLALEFLVQI